VSLQIKPNKNNANHAFTKIFINVK
jgi:hypothetical protein